MHRAALDKDGGSRRGETVSRVLDGGKRHSYTSSGRTRNDIKVEEKKGRNEDSPRPRIEAAVALAVRRAR